MQAGKAAKQSENDRSVGADPHHSTCKPETSLLFFGMMSLSRRLRHRTSRMQLVSESFYCYVFAFALIFLDLHFVGIKHYYPSFHRERLPVDAAALRATFWALIGPVLWILQDVLDQNEVWTSFWGLDWEIRGLVLAGVAFIAAATVIAWGWMLPLFVMAAAVALYLHLSRPKDSL
jgi:hypothetical protein